MPIAKPIASAILEKPYKAPPTVGIDAWQKQFTAESFKGQWQVLYFYPKDMTPGCTTESIDFQTLLEDFEAQNCAVIGVSKDSCERHQKFADKEGLRFILISDSEGRLCEDFGVWKEKINYGKKYMGIERSTFLINPEGNIVAEWRKVKVANHAAHVFETLKTAKKLRLRPPAPAK